LLYELEFLIEHSESGETILIECDFFGAEEPEFGNESGRIQYLKYIDVDLAVISDKKLCVEFSFLVSSHVRGAFEIGGQVFQAKDGKWGVDKEWGHKNNPISVVEWDIPDGFGSELNEWKILGLYDCNSVRIFAEGSLE